MHRYRKAKFHTIGVGWDDDSPNQIHPLLGLLDVLEDQESKLYPRTMEINPRSYDLEGDESYLSEQQEEAEIERITVVSNNTGTVSQQCCLRFILSSCPTHRQRR